MSEDGYFGEDVARHYDDDRSAFAADVVDPVVDVLAELAGEGAALEFGIGTGRIAVPLAARGVSVAGIELSRPMASRLAGKPGAEKIEVVIGDFATSRVDGRFSLVYLVFNTIMNLTTQEAQVSCFRNAASHLDPGGCFVIETMMPRLQALPGGQTHHPFAVKPHHWGVDEYDIASQGLVSHHLYFRGDEVERRSIPFRYVWPAELDLMAQLAGLRLRHRWAGWRGEPFTSASSQHVSVWGKSA